MSEQLREVLRMLDREAFAFFAVALSIVVFWGRGR
jgi:hypothetical protein